MYIKVSKFDLSKLLNAEYLQLMKSIKVHIERYGANILGVSPFFTLFVSLLDDALSAMESEKSSAYSQAIAEGDSLRDNDYRVLYYYVKAFTFSHVPEMKEAATQLMRVFKDAENPLTAGLDQETALLGSLVTKLRAEPYKELLTMLGATHLLDDVAESNDAFDKLDMTRTDEQSKKIPGNIKSIRLKINPVYANIRGMVNTLAAQNPESKELDEFTHLMETEVKHYRALVALRETRRNNKKTGNETGNETPETSTN
jgi:hypothetical protein